ncbi:tetratricopeptide repeat protein [Fibrella aquatica]|uniref:tetratricopeptide repeat protein n=1 Tax=Fibrella aquatica TaxID=3242487 RepID=UPI0035204815
MSLQFWKLWTKPERAVYVIGLVLVGISLGWLALAGYRGLENVVRWEVLNELVGFPTTLYQFTDGLLTYPVQGQVQTVAGQFLASPMRVYPLVATGTVAGLCVALAFALAGICRLPTLRYRLAMGAFILLLAVCRFETLGLPGGSGKWLFLGVAALFGGFSFYFHAFRTDVGFTPRLLVFLGLFAGLAVAVALGSSVVNPAMVLLGYTLPGLVLLSVGTIAFVAIEIPAAMVWLTSVSRPSARPLGMINFLFISLLYLLNLLIIWLRNTNVIDWDGLTISPFLIVGVSLVLGVWGFRRLVEQRELLSFREAGAGLYLGMASLAALTMAYAFATANDPLVELFEDIIVYSHFGMGVAFVLYIGLNFWPIYQQQLPVHRVMYKARIADLPLFRLAGLVAMVGMIAGGNYFTVRQGYAATLSALGDAYLAENQVDLAQTYYQESVAEEHQQHKGNYALASIALSRNDQAAAALFFSKALLKQPSPQAFAGLSDTYRQTNLFFESIKTLQRGIQTFPNNGELRTNLGYLYGKTAIADSAYYYLQSAVAHTQRDEVPLANLLGLYARNPNIMAADSALIDQVETRDDPAFEANRMALHLVSPRDTTAPVAPAWLSRAASDPLLDAGRFASLYNYAFVAANPDSTLLNRLQRAAQNPANQELVDDLVLAQALGRYRANQHLEAFDLLTQLAENDPKRANSYRTTLGLLQADQGLYRQANKTLALNSDTLSSFYRAVLLTKLGDLPAARPFWLTAMRQDSLLQGVRQALYSEKQPATDLEKAFYVSYRLDDANRGRTWETIRDVSLKTVSGASLIDTYLATRQYFYAQMILSQMGKPAELTSFARSMENLSAVKIASFRKKATATDSLAKTFFIPQHRALVAALRGSAFAASKQPDNARKAYEQVLLTGSAQGQLVAEASLFLRSQRQVKPAYEAVRRALPYNESEPSLLKSYVLLCLDQSLFDYAEEGMVQLQVIAPPADYQAFAVAYQQKVSAIENARNAFVQ